MEHNCPQCGAPVVLDETDRIFSCSYCRVRLYILPGDYTRYLLPPAAGISEPLFFVPYWRLKGILFSIAGDQIEDKIVDSSLLALKFGAVPVSLGFRPQVLKLRYVVPESPGNFLPADLPFRLLAGKLDSAAPAVRPAPDSRSSCRIFVGETVSMIFCPVYEQGNSLFDGILREPLGAGSLEGFPEHQPNAGSESTVSRGGRAICDADIRGRISFVPVLCPHCGWDLEGEKDSLALFCRNCSSLWEPKCAGLERLDFSFMPHNGEAPVYLPFWRIRAAVSGLPLKSYADLIRLANLPRTIPGDCETKELHFWVPAFKVQPHLFLRLAKNLTVLQKEPNIETQAPASSLFPVNIPLAEALESLKIITASIAVPKKLIFPRLPEVGFTLQDRMLVYLPFTERGEELIQPEIQMSIQKNALRWGRLM